MECRHRTVIPFWLQPSVIRNGDQKEPIGAPNDPNYASNGSDYLDDVAKYLYDGDLRSDLTNQQNIITYTIGFTRITISSREQLPMATGDISTPIMRSNWQMHFRTLSMKFWKNLPPLWPLLFPSAEWRERLLEIRSI